MAIIILLCFLLQLLSSSFHFSVAQTQATNITLGSILSAGNTSASWLSPSGDFAFGFYPVLGDRYLVGIWFHKIPEKTLVWSANRDTPVREGSTLELTRSGWLVIKDPQGNGDFHIYNKTSANSASMQDNGNFELRNSSSVFIWRSFDSPTDTVLPGQVLNMNQELFSNDNGTYNYSTGRYMLKMQEDGNLVMSAARSTERGYWWTTEANELGRNRSFIFNESSALMYIINKTDITNNVTGNIHPPKPIGDYYHRAMIDDKGNFKQYAYPRKVNGTWLVVWTAVSNPCNPKALCGENGYCVSDDKQEPSCRCLEGYTRLDLNRPWKGCYLQPSCEVKSSTVFQINDVDFSNSGDEDLAQITPSDEESCKKAVMDDCFCIAAVLQNGTCTKKREALQNGKVGSNANRRISFIKVATSNVTGLPNDERRKLRCLVGGLVPSNILAVLFAVLALYFYVSRSPKTREPTSSEINLRAYTYKELKEATDGFTRKLGRGAFGTVYSGILQSEGEQIEVAVKQLEKVIEEGEKEFKTELRVIGRTHHKNLVRLLGFCDENSHRLLVYELMKGGSLSDFLFRRDNKPSWSERAEIALGITRGLSYLHEECETQIIHCDIKPQNVLLDTNCTAKIADFGLAKLLKKDQTRTSTNVRGTMGYMAPEWLKNSPITMKVDVYSFGVMLLEIICCRRHIDLDRVEEESEEADLYITDWVISCMKAGELPRLVEQEEEVLSDLERFERMAMVGLWCVNPDPVLRPSMKRVRQMLEGTFDLGVPPLVTAYSFNDMI